MSSHEKMKNDHPGERSPLIDYSNNRIEIWKCWFLKGGGNQSTWIKTSQSKPENQQ